MIGDKPHVDELAVGDCVDGAIIAAWREQQRLTQSALGQMVGVNGSTIGGYERNTTQPSERALLRIAALMRVNPEMLVRRA